MVSTPKKDGEECFTKLAKHSSLGLGTVPLDLMVIDKLDGDRGAKALEQAAQTVCGVSSGDT